MLVKVSSHWARRTRLAISRARYSRGARPLSPPGLLTLGKSLWRSAHAKVSFPRTKVTGQPKRDEDSRRYGLLYCSNNSRVAVEGVSRVKSLELKTKISIRYSLRSSRFVSSILCILCILAEFVDSSDYELFRTKAGKVLKREKEEERYMGFHLILIQLSISWRWYRSPFGSKRRNNR